MTASSMGWMPLFLKADPQMTGKSFMAMVALRMPALISATVGASPATYFSIRWSSPASEAASATLWIISSRWSLASSRRSAGISMTSNLAPSSSFR